VGSTHGIIHLPLPDWIVDRVGLDRIPGDMSVIYRRSENATIGKHVNL
jgi:hypothetical protein